MSEEKIQVLFDKHDRHEQILMDLRIEQALHRERLDAQDRSIDTMTKDSAERHAELVTLLGVTSQKVDGVIATHHEREGREGVMKWLVPVLLTIIGLLVAIQQLPV